MPSTLDYPIEAEPKTGDGSAIEVAPGVLWFRMPLFASLPWINVWAIKEEGGWTIVDTGLRTAKTMTPGRPPLPVLWAALPCCGWW